MILLHRLTSFVTGLIILLVFAGILFTEIHPLFLFVVGVFLTAVVLARLLNWDVRSFQFWHLLGTPLLFIVSSMGVMLFLEQIWIQVFLAVGAALLLALFTEHVFSYVHLPTVYQPFSIEHLGHLMNILTMFFVGSIGFGLRLFLQMPLWFLGSIFFLVSLFVIYGTLWASKVDDARARPYAFAGGILTAELFIALSFLPSGFYTNAAFVALAFYAFLGLTRANALHRLSSRLTKRYLTIFAVLTLVIALTSQWL